MEPTKPTFPPWQPPSSKAPRGSIKQCLVINWVKRTISPLIFQQSGEEYLCTQAAQFDWTFLTIPAKNTIYGEWQCAHLKMKTFHLLPWALCQKISLCDLEHRETFCKIFSELHPHDFVFVFISPLNDSCNVFIKIYFYMCANMFLER